VRGLSAIIILKHIMKGVGKAMGRPNVKPCEVFDLIGGTSTGGYVISLEET
jgi:patatin-like phospholipase/acyl hydrolase